MHTATTHRRLGETIVRLVRTERFRSGVRGVLYLPDGSSLHTLEDKPIAPGSYFLRPDETGRFRNWVIEDVLESRSAGYNRTDIEMHVGTILADTAGCPLLGCRTTAIGIGGSRNAIKIARVVLERDDKNPPIWVLNISEAF